MAPCFTFAWFFQGENNFKSRCCDIRSSGWTSVTQGCHITSRALVWFLTDKFYEQMQVKKKKDGKAQHFVKLRFTIEV